MFIVFFWYHAFKFSNSGLETWLCLREHIGLQEDQTSVPIHIWIFTTTCKWSTGDLTHTFELMQPQYMTYIHDTHIHIHKNNEYLNSENPEKRPNFPNYRSFIDLLSCFFNLFVYICINLAKIWSNLMYHTITIWFHWSFSISFLFSIL